MLYWSKYGKTSKICLTYWNITRRKFKMKSTTYSTLKFFIVSCIMLLFLFVKSPINVFAQDVKVTLPTFGVTMNAEKISNEYRKYPFIVYKDITYFPMTWNDSRFLGLTTNFTSSTGLEVYQTNALIPFANNKPDLQRAKNSKQGKATLANFKIKVNGKVIDNSKETHPLLLFKGVTYFPITWRFAVNEFKWDYQFTRKEGLKINSTVVEKSATYEKFNTIVVGKTTRKGLELLFGQSLRRSFIYNDRDIARSFMVGSQSGKAIHGIFKKDERESSNQVVYQKDYIDNTSSGNSKDIEMDSFEMIKIGMGKENVLSILGDASTITETRDTLNLSWNTLDQFDLYKSTYAARFTQKNGRWKLIDKAYSNYADNIYIDYSNPFVTLENINTLEKLDTYEEVCNTLGGEGFLTSFFISERENDYENYVWIGEDGELEVRIKFNSVEGELLLESVDIMMNY